MIDMVEGGGGGVKDIQREGKRGGVMGLEGGNKT